MLFAILDHHPQQQFVEGATIIHIYYCCTFNELLLLFSNFDFSELICRCCDRFLHSLVTF
jgi:hypothetical protein